MLIKTDVELSDALNTLWYMEPEIGIDLETSGLSPFNDKIAVIAMHGPLTNKTFVFHIRGSMWPKLLDFFNSSTETPKTFIGHNITCFDLMFLYNAGVNLSIHKYFDTLIGEQVLITSNRADVRKNLEATVKRRLGKVLDKSIAHGGWMNPVLTRQQMDYVEGDIKHLYAIKEKQLQEAHKKGLTDALNFEMSLIPSVLAMQQAGLPVDIPALRKWREDAKLRSQAAGIKLTERLGPINLNSIVQLNASLKHLGIDWPTTGKEQLQEVIQDGYGAEQAIAELILEYRFGTKRASIYSDEWIRKFVHPGTRELPFLHSRFSQLGTDTGRFSSSEPNLQQLPKVTVDGQMVGRPYIGGLTGYKLVSVDYSGIEAVVAAAIAKDQAYLKMLSAGDMHRSVGSAVFGVPPEEITPTQRQLSKAMSFTLLFGGGSGRLLAQAKSNGANITLEEATALKDQFFRQFPGLMRMRRQAYMLAGDGIPVTIELPTGLRRVMVGRSLVGTSLLNTKVQGTAAAGMKHALLKCMERGLMAGPEGGVAASVHDELVAWVPEKHAESFSEELKKAMLDGMKEIPELQSAPIKVSASIGDYWAK